MHTRAGLTALMLTILSGDAIAQTNNPLLTESPLPYHLPPFEQIKDEHYQPAIEQGMVEQIAEWEKIANNREAPTFENTVEALQRSGVLFERALRAFRIIRSSLTNPALQKLDAELAPRLAAHTDAMFMNAPLFARIEGLYEKRDSLGLDAESKQLLRLYYLDFVRGGAKLSVSDKARMRELNSAIAKLSAQFRRNALSEVNASQVIVETRDELKGWSDAAIQAAAQDGKYAIRLTNTSGQPPLTVLENADVRKRVMEASLSRGMRGNEFDNRAVVLSIVRKRAELANLLGFANFAAYQLADQTAGSVDAVNKMLARMAPAAVANARKEATELQAVAGRAIGAGDWAFYSEQVRRTKYAFDGSQVRPYFEIRRVLVDGVFYAATKLYGITFKERKDLKGYSPDMYVFEVFNEDGSPLGLFLGDFYARPNKQGGAWANAYVPQSTLTGDKTVSGIHLNVPKPPEGQPTLLTHDEVETMFHEFGHALHSLFSDVKYTRLSRVPRDFVEFPSQVNEMWMTWPEVLRHFAVHHETGKPMPKELLEKIQAAENFNQGFKTTEYLAATVLDQAWHQLKTTEIPDDVAAFEASALKKYGLDFAAVPPRYRSTYFSHVYSYGYEAGYYSYIWSEILDADTVEWFKQNGGLKRANGDRFRKALLSRGGTKDAMQLYRDFRGAEPDPVHLMKRRGLQ
ncbi:MAG: M3 family metallopeptidase [Acidobacteriota bacterium]